MERHKAVRTFNGAVEVDHVITLRKNTQVTHRPG